jgi:cytochrome P450
VKLLGAAEMDFFGQARREAIPSSPIAPARSAFARTWSSRRKATTKAPACALVGKTILSMVGKEHKRLRSAAQPLFKRPKVLDWWNKRWIEETVDALLDRLLDGTRSTSTSSSAPACRWPRDARDRA